MFNYFESVILEPLLHLKSITEANNVKFVDVNIVPAGND
jgi:hypothetical protein